MAAEFMQNLCPVGVGPSVNRWPRCELQSAQITSVLDIPWLKSGTKLTLPGIASSKLGQPLPESSELDAVECTQGEIASLVDVDFDAYRRAHDNRTVRRNVTLPAWLGAKARQSDLNVSAVLQAALKHELKVE